MFGPIDIILIGMINQERIIIVLLIIVGGHTACWNNEPTTRIGNINPITMLTNSSANVLSVTTTFSSNLSSLTNLKTGLGLIGYESYLTTTFSFNTTVGNVDVTSLSVIVQPKDNTYLVNIKLRYIVTEMTAPNMDLLMACFKCMNISQGWGNRNQTLGSQNSTSMANTATLKIRSFFYAFNYTNLMGTNNFFQINSYNNGTYYIHIVTTSDNTTINFICLTTIIWESSLDAPGAGIASIFETYSITPLVNTTSILYYSVFNCADLGFFGLSMISHTMGGERLFAIYPQTYNLINSQFSSNSYFMAATLEVIYIGSLNCPTIPNVYDPSTLSCAASCAASITATMNNTCVSCISICLTCSPTNSSSCVSCYANTNRTGITCSCAPGYYQAGQPACAACNTSIQYCTACANASFCNTCSGPSPNAISGQCYCNSTASSYLVNGVCLTFPGCLLAFSATNANYCQTCDATNNFELDSATNLTCRCKGGFNNTGNLTTCKATCGNGNVTGKSCDDNNTTPNDGCTNCTVDSGYYCYIAVNTNGPSICIHINTSSISYQYAQRIPGTNQAKLYFTIFLPQSSSIPSSTFTGHISTNVSYDILTAIYDQSSAKITVTVEFTKNMEGNNYYFTFNFSALTTFYANPVTVNVVTAGINQQLILLSLNMLVKTLQYVVMGLAVLGILIALVSSIVGYKLMGLQLILPLQGAYFIQLAMQNPPPYVAELNSLSYSNGFNHLFSYNFYNYYLQQSKLPKFLFSVEYGFNVNIMVGVLLLSTLVLIVLQLVYLWHHSKTKAQQSEQVQVKVSKKNMKQKKENIPPQVKKEDEQLQLKVKSARERRNAYLNHFYFTVAMIMIQQCIFSFLADNSQMKVGAEILGEDINLLLSYISLILIVPNLIYLVDQYFEKKEKRALTFPECGRYKYPVLLVTSYAILAVVLGLTFTYSFSLYIALVISVLPLLILILMKPYKKNPFTICIISALTNQIMLIGAVAVYFANSIMALPQIGWLISVIVVVCLIFISQGLTIVRMIKVIPWKELELIKRFCKKDKNKEKVEKAKAEKQDLLDKKPDVQMAEQIKNNLIAGDNKMLNWEQKNSKEYHSIKSGKLEKQGDEQNENSQENQEDELLLLKRRLKKQINTKRSKI